MHPLITRTNATALTAEDLAELHDVRLRAGDFFVEAGDPPPTPESFQADLDDLPEGFTRADELIYRAYREGRAVGYAEVLRGFARPDQWIVGIVLVDGSQRGSGIGGSIVRAIAADAMAVGAGSLAAGVIVSRRRSLAFWRREGFTEEVARRLVTVAGAEDEVVRLECRLPGSHAGAGTTLDS